MAVVALKSNHAYAVGKQTAEGTAQSVNSNLWQPSLYGGQVRPQNDEQQHQTADSNDLPPGSYIRSASWDGSPEFNTDVDWLGLVLLLHFGSGSDAVTGAGPYVHTFTRQQAPLFGTHYLKRPDVLGGTDRWDQGVDGFTRAIELSASAPGEALHVMSEIVGKTYNHGATAPVPTNVKRLSNAGGYLTFQGATMKFDLDATPAATQTHAFTNWVLRSEYANAVWRQTDELVGRYLARGRYGLAMTGTLTFEDFTPLRSTFFGAKNPTLPAALSNIPVFGALDFLFPIGGQAADATKQLQVQVPNVRFRAEPIDPDSSGDAAEYAITGTLYKPAAGAETTWILKNTTPSY